VSRLATSHFHINVAEWSDVADSIKPFNRNRKTLGKEKCLSWVISDWWNAMAQSRDKVRTDLINRTECIEGNEKEMIIVGDFSVLIVLAFGRRSSCLGYASRWYTQARGGHSISNRDIPGIAQRPSRHGIRVRLSERLLSDLRRPCGSLMDDKPGSDKALPYQIIDKMMALGAAWIAFTV